MGMTSAGNFLVAAFDASGAPLWTRELDVVPGEDDYLTGLAVDSAGNTIVAGPVGTGFGGFETVMLDPAGEVVWTDNEFGAFGSSLGGAFVAVDADDEIVVTAVAESTGGLPQARTWRVAPDGARLWTQVFPTGFCDTGEPVDMTLDRHGNALVLCESMINGEGGSFNFTTIKYDAAGNEIWRHTLPRNDVDLPSAIAVDGADNVYIAGATGIGGNNYDALVASYDAAGALRWTRILNSATGGDFPADLAVGRRGEVYYSGFGFFQDSNEDILTVKLQQAPASTSHR